MQIRPMTIEDYDEVYAMWQITTKRALSPADSRDSLARYLGRNPEMSQVALADGKIVGTVLAGHDGRIGFIHHMAVLPEYRRHHIGKQLATKALEKIFEDGIDKTQIYCYIDNETGQNFWKSLGFERTDNVLFELKTKD
ncbi:MAG: GNAT family N-acetyltransferase [Ruminococcus sp.]|nr:GNAT family N-acetyltransferase [Ruminococcus sp.]